MSGVISSRPELSLGYAKVDLVDAALDLAGRRMELLILLSNHCAVNVSAELAEDEAATARAQNAERAGHAGRSALALRLLAASLPRFATEGEGNGRNSRG